MLNWSWIFLNPLNLYIEVNQYTLASPDVSWLCFHILQLIGEPLGTSDQLTVQSSWSVSPYFKFNIICIKYIIISLCYIDIMHCTSKSIGWNYNIKLIMAVFILNTNINKILIYSSKCNNKLLHLLQLEIISPISSFWSIANNMIIVVEAPIRAVFQSSYFYACTCVGICLCQILNASSK